jgi:transposase
MPDYWELMSLRSLGLNISQIADSLGASRTTVIHTLQRAVAQGLDWQRAEVPGSKEISALLFPGGEGLPSYKAPDDDDVHRELMKPGTTQQLLWMEYCDQCRDAGEIPYQFTAFKRHDREHAAQRKSTMHINRKPGEIMASDWEGQKAQITDCDTGEPIDAYVFVATLPYSGYAYAEAFLSMEQDALGRRCI